MKQKNRPARKLRRQLNAQGECIGYYNGEYISDNPIALSQLHAASQIRTKKDRSGKSRLTTG